MTLSVVGKPLWMALPPCHAVTEGARGRERREDVGRVSALSARPVCMARFRTFAGGARRTVAVQGPA
jgi:hypothetical protein